MKKTLNPHYNHTFVYNGVRLEDLQHMCLELTVWDREPLASNDFLGGVRLGVGTGETFSPIQSSLVLKAFLSLLLFTALSHHYVQRTFLTEMSFLYINIQQVLIECVLPARPKGK